MNGDVSTIQVNGFTFTYRILPLLYHCKCCDVYYCIVLPYLVLLVVGSWDGNCGDN